MLLRCGKRSLPVFPKHFVRNTAGFGKYINCIFHFVVNVLPGKSSGCVFHFVCSSLPVSWCTRLFQKLLRSIFLSGRIIQCMCVALRSSFVWHPEESPETVLNYFPRTKQASILLLSHRLQLPAVHHHKSSWHRD